MRRWNIGCGCCYPDEPSNKPTAEQSQAALIQQDAVPELFKEFVPMVAPPPETISQTSPTAPAEPAAPILDKKWVKV